MRLARILSILAAMCLTAAAGDLSGKWKVSYTGPPGTGPKTIGSMIFDLKVEGAIVTGIATIGYWPGEAPVAEGKFEGDRITFTATGHLSSTTGIPTCQIVAIVKDGAMEVTLSVIRNAGGPLGPGRSYQYSGKKLSD
jgi:hypothetical protein